MIKRNILLLGSLLFLTHVSMAQKKSKLKFGKISESDFNQKIYPVDSSAAAVIIADIGSTVFEGNRKGTFSLIFKRFQRAHILNKNGFNVANIEIPLFHQDNLEEQLLDLNAVTYNLVNGKVEKTKLDTKAEVFQDVIDKNLLVKKFTFPNIKPGSIIEFEYEVHSDYIFNLQPWIFQGEFPRLWSEYNVAMPEFYSYVTLKQGYQDYFIQEHTTRNELFRMSDSKVSFQTSKNEFYADVTDYKWVMKDVPSLRTESYTTTIHNYISKIEFQLQSINHPFEYQNVMNTWAKVSKDLLDEEDFGAPIQRENGWLKDEVNEAVKGATTKLQKAKNIYNWVRDHFVCTNHNKKYLDNTLRNVLKNKNGSEAEINMLLIAMLRVADIQADPVMLSTRSHGFVHPLYPLLNRYNYVICLAKIDDTGYYLDASEPVLGFGKLQNDCYNGLARVINVSATPVELLPSTISNSSNTLVFIFNTDDGKTIGSMTKKSGYFTSIDDRIEIKKNGESNFIKKQKNAIQSDFIITKFDVDSINNYESSINEKMEFEVKNNGEDMIYLNPMLMDRMGENPFKSAKRLYPVELPYIFDETYTLQMDIPKGYEVEELPKQAVVKLGNDQDAVFEYRISSDNSTISFRTRLQIIKTLFPPEEYANLREFFNFVVKKQGEQIVLKKKTRP